MRTPETGRLFRRNAVRALVGDSSKISRPHGLTRTVVQVVAVGAHAPPLGRSNGANGTRAECVEAGGWRNAVAKKASNVSLALRRKRDEYGRDRKKRGRVSARSWHTDSLSQPPN